MRRLIVLIMVVAIIGGGAYLYFFKKKEVKELADSAQGYPAAKKQKEAADLFRKAIQARKYDKAAKYTTEHYSEMLKKGDDAARKLGEAIDNLTYQMNERSVTTDEMKIILYGFDPFPKNILITVDKETDKDAVASFAPDGITLTGQQRPYSTWKIDTNLWGALYVGVPLKTKIVKEGDNWKLDVPVTPAMQASVARLNDKYKYYAQLLEKLSTELKNDATTKEDFKNRLKTILEDAAKD